VVSFESTQTPFRIPPKTAEPRLMIHNCNLSYCPDCGSCRFFIAGPLHSADAGGCYASATSVNRVYKCLMTVCNQSRRSATVAENVSAFLLKQFYYQKRCDVWPWLLLITNKKSHKPFQLTPKSTTLDDFERPYRTLLYK